MTPRLAAHETGAGVRATEEQFVELIGPVNKGLVEIWSGLTGAKPVTEVRQPEGGDRAHLESVFSASEKPTQHRFRNAVRQQDWGK